MIIDNDDYNCSEKNSPLAFGGLGYSGGEDSDLGNWQGKQRTLSRTKSKCKHVRQVSER